MRKAVKNNKDVETLAGVHTHTHRLLTEVKL